MMRTSCIHRFVIPVVALTLAACGDGSSMSESRPEANAPTYGGGSIEELATASDVIVLGEASKAVTGVMSGVLDGTSVKIFPLRVDRSLRGAVTGRAAVVVLDHGGTDYPPAEIAVGAPALLFLRAIQEDDDGFGDLRRLAGGDVAFYSAGLPLAALAVDKADAVVPAPGIGLRNRDAKVTRIALAEIEQVIAVVPFGPADPTAAAG
jgi:hypothetical protein